MAIVQFLLALLLVSSTLGIAACIRRGLGLASWLLGGAIACTAVLGVWRYIHVRSLTANNEARIRRDVEAFVRPARILSADMLIVRLTWTVPCDAFGDSVWREICSGATPPSGAAREEIAKRFMGPIEIGLTPAQRMIREGDDSLLHYVIRDYGSSVRVEPDLLKQRASMTIEAEARPERHGRKSPPFIAVASAEIRVTVPLPGCAEAPCVPTGVGILCGGQWFCAERMFRLGNRHTYVGRLAACDDAVAR